MPRIEDRTVGDQIHEYLAPVQPDDCRAANLEILAHALTVTGPVVHQGQVVSAKADGSIDFDGSRTAAPNPPTATTDEDGTVHEVPPRELTDADMATQWGFPAANAIPLLPLQKSEA